VVVIGWYMPTNVLLKMPMMAAKLSCFRNGFSTTWT